MGRIHVLPDRVANQIAAGEVVERPASVVKELLENALDAGARRIKIQVEAGGKKLIQITDDGCGMVHDDALLAFERHATSKIKDADDLLNIATLGFRGEALPSIAAVSRMALETRASRQSSVGSRQEEQKQTVVGRQSSVVREEQEQMHCPSTRSPSPGSVELARDDKVNETGTRIELAGGKMLRVEEAGLPAGTSVTVRDLFFNVPARKKFLKAESTELSHVAQLVTHYALAHPELHFELHSATNAMLMAAPVATHAERIFQIFGKETLDELLPVAAHTQLEHAGLPQPPPWKRSEDYQPPEPGELRLHGFVSKPEIQKLNRNSIFIFVNQRLIRDRLVQHAITEAYRNILPSAVYPVVLLFLEMPGAEVDVNVHPSKTEVRFRQQSLVHDFVRDTVRAALLKARPVPGFLQEITAQPRATPGLTPGTGVMALGENADEGVRATDFALRAPELPPMSRALDFSGAPIAVEANAAVALPPSAAVTQPVLSRNGGHCGGAIFEEAESEAPASLAHLRPLGQVRNSFIVAADGGGLWIIDQHVAHERVLFERILRQRARGAVDRQALLLPLVIELTPAQQAVFAEIGEELARNGFEAEPFGARTLAIKAAPAGVEAAAVERLLHEILDHAGREERGANLEKLGGEIAASIACHAAIKVNMQLEPNKMEWLLRELARTECPMTCPHGRPVLLRYSLREIERAFKRI